MHRSRMRSNDFVKTKDPLDPENFYADAANPHGRKHGIILIDGKEVAATLQCAHHGGHFTHRKNRGDWICGSCGGVVCGRKQCIEMCVPFEKQLEDAESGGSFR